MATLWSVKVPLGMLVVFHWASQPYKVGVAVAMTSLLNVPPLISKLTPATPDDALASKRAAVPDCAAPFEGMRIAVVGGGIVTIIV